MNSRNPCEGILRILIQAGADVNARTDSMRTPLFSAAFSNVNPDVVMILIEAGADVDARDEEGNTPLDITQSINNSPRNNEKIEILRAAVAREDSRRTAGAEDGNDQP